MSDVLISWCNSLNLRHPVGTLEESFSNGFLFGDLLRLYNQQHDFPAAFRDSTRTADIVANFKALQPTLVRMGIKVGAQLVEDVMHAVPGAAPRLLYEIKSKLALLERVEVGRPKPGLYKTLANIQVLFLESGPHHEVCSDRAYRVPPGPHAQARLRRPHAHELSRIAPGARRR